MEHEKHNPNLSILPVSERGIEVRKDWKDIAKNHTHSITEKESKEWNREVKNITPEEIRDAPEIEDEEK